jgi:probable HAF family extracellular repeat protein
MICFRTAIMALTVAGVTLQTRAALTGYHQIVVPGMDTIANDISGDGRVVVGEWSSSTQLRRPFRWTVESGLTFISGTRYTAMSTSRDGSFSAGHGNPASGNQSTRWRPDGGQDNLGYFGNGTSGPQSRGHGISADGSVVVGWSSGTPSDRAFRWTPTTGLVNLGTLSGGSLSPSSYANAVSADGSVVVGQGNNTNVLRAFRWTQNTGMQALPGTNANAHGISADASVIVGEVNHVAAIWTNGGSTLRSLGALAGDGGSRATACSLDGSVIIGFSANPDYERAFIWTEATGMRELAAVAADLGINLHGDRLPRATSISDDGRTILGLSTMVFTGTQPSFVLTIPTAPSGICLGLLLALSRRRRQRHVAQPNRPNA